MPEPCQHNWEHLAAWDWTDDTGTHFHEEVFKCSICGADRYLDEMESSQALSPDSAVATSEFTLTLEDSDA